MTRRAYQIAFWAAITAIMIFALTPLGAKFTRHIWDKINHFVAFFILSFLGDRAFEKSLLSISLYLVGFGLLIEAIQFMLPYRSLSVPDMLANICGIFLYAMLKFGLESFKGKSSLS